MNSSSRLPETVAGSRLVISIDVVLNCSVLLSKTGVQIDVQGIAMGRHLIGTPSPLSVDGERVPPLQIAAPSFKLLAMRYVRAPAGDRIVNRLKLAEQAMRIIRRRGPALRSVMAGTPSPIIKFRSVDTKCTPRWVIRAYPPRPPPIHREVSGGLVDRDRACTGPASSSRRTSWTSLWQATLEWS